jgi:DNA-binding transcriptional regulator LsrR (DeoR family)
VTIGVGWGRTLNQALRRLPPRPVKQATVVSLLGGLARAQPLNPTECAWALAEKIGAACYLLPAPAYADTPESRDAFMSQRAVQEVLNRARRADIALLSVGSLGPDGPVSNYGFLGNEEIEDLKALGAVGDLLCHFLDGDGALIDHPVNRRVCAFPAGELSRIPKVVIASGGYEKIGVLRSALKLTRASVLITDESAAAGLLAG